MPSINEISCSRARISAAVLTASFAMAWWSERENESSQFAPLVLQGNFPECSIGGVPSHARLVWKPFVSDFTSSVECPTPEVAAKSIETLGTTSEQNEFCAVHNMFAADLLNAQRQT